MRERMERVNELIHREVSDILQRDMRDSRFGMFTVTEVRVSKDLRYAKIFISIYGKESQKENAMLFLKKRTAFIQSQVGSHVHLRYTPHLQFLMDETREKMDRIDSVLKELKIKV